MISKMISILLIAIVIFSVSLLVYGLILIYRFNGNKGAEIPFPFDSMYNALSEIVFVRLILEYLQRSFYLIHVNKAKSEVLAALSVLLMPPIFIIVFTLINMLSPVWYLSVVLFIVCILIPYYILRSYVVKKCIIIRISLLKSFTSLTSLLSTGTVATASEDMIFSTYGSVREIYKEFIRLYRMDKSSAYGFVVYISGDSYTQGVMDSLKSFDTEGDDPVDEINKICKQGLDIFTLQLMGFRQFTQLKLSSGILLVGVIAMKYFGNYLGSMMNFQYNDTIGFFSIIMILASLTLGFAFESNV